MAKEAAQTNLKELKRREGLKTRGGTKHELSFSWKFIMILANPGQNPAAKTTWDRDRGSVGDFPFSLSALNARWTTLVHTKAFAQKSQIPPDACLFVH
ncbi:hypothetical protein H2200_005624 [Cladophialophora chaetospira]|uniref:Uncharacterized protein n=1 Tax=Cladophialophora chaetospira TaxID=386627 RepID=A0AA39CJS5_9EURO|nr:hypothetical protein H2200_005624 [Cladophialophora chaetospira]